MQRDKALREDSIDVLLSGGKKKTVTEKLSKKSEPEKMQLYVILINMIGKKHHKQTLFLSSPENEVTYEVSSQPRTTYKQ